MWFCVSRCTEHFYRSGIEHFLRTRRLQQIAILIIYYFYPETSCRTLEEIDLLFASNTLWVWETEKRFRELKLEHQELVHGVDHRHRQVEEDLEEVKYGMGMTAVEDVSQEGLVSFWSWPSLQV